MKAKVTNKNSTPRKYKGIEFSGEESKEMDISQGDVEELRKSLYFRVEVVEKNVEQAQADEADFVCDECGDEFDSERGLNLHKSKMH